MKKHFFLLLLLCPLVLFAQRVPDEDDILAKILDSESRYYYPSLMLRYIGGDTTLTYDDYYYLYYGYAYDENYKPLESPPAENPILEVFSETEHPDRLQAHRIIEAAKDNMLFDPFSPRNINYLTYAYGLIGDTVNERINADRFRKVIHTIRSSGTGLKEDSPWHILYWTHADDVLGSMGLDIENKQVRTRSVEYISLKKRDGKAKGYFFDFSRIYRKQPEKTPKRKRPNWMLNDYPL